MAELYRGWTIKADGAGRVFASCEGATYGPFSSVAAAKRSIYCPAPTSRPGPAALAKLFQVRRSNPKGGSHHGTRL